MVLWHVTIYVKNCYSDNVIFYELPWFLWHGTKSTRGKLILVVVIIKRTH